MVVSFVPYSLNPKGLWSNFLRYTTVAIPDVFIMVIAIPYRCNDIVVAIRNVVDMIGNVGFLTLVASSISEKIRVIEHIFVYTVTVNGIVLSVTISVFDYDFYVDRYDLLLVVRMKL